MPSLRLTRKSPRTTSPKDTIEQNQQNGELRSQAQNNRVEGWTEPPVRTPVPSFQDHRGLERQGVLEHMAPLGTPPNPKVWRQKQYEGPTRRFTQTTLDEGFTTSKEPRQGINEQTSRSNSQKPRHSNKAPVVNEDGDYQDNTSKVASVQPHTKKFPVLKTGESSPSIPFSHPWTIQDQDKIRDAVEHAVLRSVETNTGSIGLAIKQLYEDSFKQPHLAALLNAVLAQNATRTQISDFQAYIKVTKKRFRSDTNSSRRSSATVAASPSKSISASPSVKVKSADLPTSKRKSGELEPSSRVLRTTNHQKLLSTTMKSTGPTSPDQEHPPSKRQKREMSAGSSPLSSTHSDNLESMLEEASDPLPETVTPVPAPMPAPRSQPKPATAKSSPGPKLAMFSTKKVNGSTAKRSAEAAGLTLDNTFDIVAKRRELERSFDDYEVNESNIRTSPTARILASSPDMPTITSTQTPPITQQPHLRNGTQAVDDHDSLRSSASSVHGDLLIPPPPGAMRRSRGPTPTALGRPPKQLRKTARIKVSPMKKKTGVIAGVGRMGGGRDSPVGYGHMDDNGDHDNVDYCTACSGNGQLLCCDGCIRSFHFTCLDPPVDPNHPPEGQWYCYICESKRDPQPQTPRGVFSFLTDGMDQRNPIAFNLPLELRGFFEGVKTGEEGEYEEFTGLGKTRARGGYDESPDHFKLKDAKGNTVLCFKCGKSSMGKREIINCDYCTLRWHLDCLDPPLANAPVRVTNDGIKLNWMCPIHIDHELQALNSTDKLTAHPHVHSGRIHKSRRPKNARIVDTSLRRGFANNGMIEIENELSDDEEEDAEKRRYGTVYRLSEKGIKLDFIDRVNVTNHEETLQRRRDARARQERQTRLVAAAKARKEAFDKRPLADRKAALNLVQFAQMNLDTGLDSDRVENLISTLIAEAPSEVLSLDEPKKQPSVPPTPPGSESQELGAEKEMEALEKLEELIRRRKGALVGLAPEA